MKRNIVISCSSDSQCGLSLAVTDWTFQTLISYEDLDFLEASISYHSLLFDTTPAHYFFQAIPIMKETWRPFFEILQN